VEATFLIEHVEDMLIAEVQKDALAALPDCSVRVTFTQVSHRTSCNHLNVPQGYVDVVRTITPCDQAVAELERIRLSPQTVAAGERVDSELRGLIKLVRSLGQGVGPSLQEFNGYSQFFKTCLKRCENFNFVECLDSPSKGKLNFDKSSLLLGPKAIEFQVGKIRQAHKSGASLTLKDIQPFRTYNWALPSEVRCETDKWVDAILRQHMSLNNRIEDDTSKDNCQEQLPGCSSSASSSKALVPMGSVAASAMHHELSPTTEKLKVGAKKDKTAEHEAFVLSFFSGKGKAA
jgi:hypothetical protein